MKAAYTPCPSCKSKDVKLISYGSGGTKRTTFKWRCGSCGIDYHGPASRKGQVQTRFEAKLTESVKEFILGKIHAALLSLAVDPSAWEPIEDAVFSAALSGKLGDGSVSDTTGAAIGDMVTQLAATKAAPMPNLVNTEAPNVLAGDSVGAEVGLSEPVTVQTPPVPADGETPEQDSPEFDLPAPGTSEDEISAMLDAPVDDAPISDEPLPEEPSSEEKIDEPLADEEGIAAEKGVTADDVDPEELKKGIEVEKEHTDDEETATKIAVDHLAEDPAYYTKLAKMEKSKKEHTRFIPGEQILVEVANELIDARVVNQRGNQLEVETKAHMLLIVPTSSVTSLSITEDEISHVVRGDDVDAILDQIAARDILDA